MLRRLKISYQVYNFFNKKYLKHNIPIFKKFGLNKRYYSSISSEDFKGIKEELNIYDKNDSSLLLKNDKAFLKLDEKTQNAIVNWSENGYAILKGYFSNSEVDSINQEIDKLKQQKKIKFKYVSKKLMFANRESKLINDFGNGRMKQLLEVLLQKKNSTVSDNKLFKRKSATNSFRRYTYDNFSKR